MSKNILLIVEGKKAEVKFLEKMISAYRDDNVEIISYGTNIHVLWGEMKKDPDIDIINLLKETATEKDREKLSRRYTDIYLIFDMEPQDQRFSQEDIRDMLNYFNDSTDNGKLYINYPMLECYKHIDSEWSEKYYSSTVKMNDVPNYKETVNKEGLRKLRYLAQYDKSTFDMILLMNLIKTNRILSNTTEKPSYHTYIKWNSIMILNKQLEKLDNESEIYILNTSVFNIVDYNPKKILDDLSENC